MRSSVLIHMRVVLLSLLAWSLFQSPVHANDYYTHGSFPANGSSATASSMRAELDLITTSGFDKLPALTSNGGKAVVINGGGTAMTVTTGTLSLAGNFAISGAYATTLTVTAATTVTLPTTGTLATLAGAEVLTNKTLTAPTINGTVATTGLTLPAFTAGGTIGGATGITSVGTITTGTWNGTIVNHKYGGTSQNAGFSATVSANALTLTLTDTDGNAPSASTPVNVSMRSATLTTPTQLVLTRTSALTLVVPDTATLGTTNGVAYRLWVGASTSDGTTLDALVIFNTQNGTESLYALSGESGLPSATAITTGSDSAGTLYGTVVTTSKPLKWLGYIEIQEATAGTWATAPTTVQWLMPGVHRSGDRLTMQHARYSTETSNTTSSSADTGLTANITPSSLCNRVLVDVHVNGVSVSAVNSVAVSVTLTDGANTVLAILGDAIGYTATVLQNVTGGTSIQYLDAPASTASKTYKARFFSKLNNETAYVQFGTAVSSITLQEIFP